MFYTIVVFLCIFYSFFIVKNKALTNSGSRKNLISLPQYYGYNAALWVSFCSILIFLVFHYNFNLPNYISLITTIICNIGIISFFLRKKLDRYHARKNFEKTIHLILKFSAFASIGITAAIVLSIIFESIKFFEQVSIFDFLFGLEWSPQVAIRNDQAGSSGAFGVVPVFLGTFLITFIAMLVAVPLGIISAIYLSEYAKPKFRKYTKAILEILAGIPTVVYGYFAAFTVAPMVKDVALFFGLNATSESALAAGLVMGIMIIPFVLSLSDDVMTTVPESLRDASLALGATRSETTKKVVFPAALPGIIGAVLLAVSRAIGETMIVTMAAGLAANLTVNPLNSVTTATAQIITLLVGDQEFDSVKTQSAFALGMTLFVLTLVLNVIALLIVKKYHEQYD